MPLVAQTHFCPFSPPFSITDNYIPLASMPPGLSLVQSLGGTGRGTCWVSCRMSLCRYLSDVFLQIRLDIEEEDCKDKMPFVPSHIEGVCCQHDWSLLMLTFVTWLKYLSVFSIIKLLLPCPLSYCGLWREGTMCHSN